MSEDVPSSGLTDRVRQILAVYEKPGASVAQLLCDNHDPASIAYRVVASDLSACELTYDELATSSRRLANSLAAMGLGQGDRSEEHTSELQSLTRISYAVFCLKQKTTNQHQFRCSNDINSKVNTIFT